MISQDVKEFIEKNINLLETNKQLFLAKGLSRLRGTSFEVLINILEDSQIDFDSIRETMLINKLSFIFQDVYDKTCLLDVVTGYLMPLGNLRFFGLTPSQLMKFIVEHQDKWSDDMILETIDGVICVRTNNE